MERKDVKKLDTLLQQFVKSHNLERGLAEYRLMKSWGDLLGVSVSRKTRDMYIRNRKLFVTLHSSVVRNELVMIRDTLVGRLNEAAGMHVIDDIVLR